MEFQFNLSSNESVFDDSQTLSQTTSDFSSNEKFFISSNKLKNISTKQTNSKRTIVERRKEQLPISPDFYTRKTKYNILLVSDFFFPGLGGVEVHIFQLA